MEKKDAVKIREVISEILKRDHLDHKMLENRVVRSWEKVIGKNCG